MRSEYVALVHPDPDYRRPIVANVQITAGLSLVFSSRSIDVLSNLSDDIVPLNERGVLIGHLFHRHGNERAVDHLAPDATNEIIASRAAALLSRYWGSYVALLQQPDGILVVRDPSAAMPCYHCETEGVAVFASDAGVLRRSGLLSPTVDWESLARHLYSDGLPSSRTAITGVEELPPGTAMRIDGDRREVQSLWSPWHHVTPLGPDFATAADRLRSVVRRSITSWASLYERPLVGVSGGLDSSIVAACLAADAGTTLCMTMATADADGDERAFAELLCREIHLELATEFFDLEEVDLDRSVAPHLPLPVSRAQTQSYNAAVARLARMRSIGAFFTGNGGDNVFAFSQSAAALYDRYRHEGWRRGLLSTLADTCKLTGCSPWQALLAARKIGEAASPSYQWRAEPMFLHADVLAREARIPMAHPWLEAPADALPGKAAHIAGLLRVQRNLHTSEHAMGIPIVNPLMAQPVIETCLQVPSWVWREGGVNRAVARSAFSTVLPQAIAYRSTKGRPDSFCNEIISAKRADIAARLLNGQMVGAGLLDREAIRRTLFDPVPDMGVEQVRLLALVEIEAWLGYWRAG